MFFFGCDEEEESWLDESLFGTWKSEEWDWGVGTTDVYYNFNQNGTYEYFGGSNNENGDWWVDGDVLLTSIVGDDGIPNSKTYDVFGDSLRFHNQYPAIFLNKYDEPVAEEGDPPFYQIFIKQ